MDASLFNEYTPTGEESGQQKGQDVGGMLAFPIHLEHVTARTQTELFDVGWQWSDRIKQHVTHIPCGLICQKTNRMYFVRFVCLHSLSK